MKKNLFMLLLALTLLLLCGCTTDLTGMSYSEIEAFIAENPNKKVTYTVTITGDTYPLEITNEDTEASCTLTQVDSLVAQAEYLQHLTKLWFANDTMDADSYAALRAAFPNAELFYP